MFGYVKAKKSELRVWEFETYKAVYCSLCRQLGKTYGPLARLTLSYDFTYLALLCISLEDGTCSFSKKRCAFNPLKKCNYCTNCQPQLELASAAAMVMVYYKLLDNIEDSSGAKKLFYKALKPYFRAKHKKAAKTYPHIQKIVESYIAAQDRLERENCCDLDRIADPTSNALGEIFKLISTNPIEQRALYQLGYGLGKWIYLCDLGDDIEKDIKSGAFNPLKGEIPKDAHPVEYAKARLTPLLNSCIHYAALGYELLNIKKYKGILDNILYSGLPAVQESVFKKEKNKA